MRATLFGTLAALFATAATADSAPPAEATITYLTSTTAYLDAGTEGGLERGSVVTVIRDGAPVTTLEVTALSSRRASCSRPENVELRVGDRVTFVPARRTRPAPSPAPAPAARARNGDGRRIGGRVGLRYLGFRDRSPVGGSYSQPGLDVRIEGSSLPGHLDVSVDARTRRTWRTLGDGTEDRNGRTRVYALLARWRPSGRRGLAVTAGRQVAAALASVSIFDGVSASWTEERLSAGAFAGTQPDVETFGWADRIREWGAWFGWQNAATPTRVGVTAGFVGSWDDGILDREYFVMQGRLRRPTFSGRVTQEIDLNRGWKRESESLVSPTSTLLTARWDVRPRVSLDAGFDSRRAVRLHRHHVTPETEFDDSTRRGTWGGIRVRPLSGTTLGASFRRSAGGDAGVANSVTATLRTSAPALRGVSVGLRSTRYSNARLDGWLHSVTAGAPVGSRVRAGLGFGMRKESDESLPDGGNDLRWASVDLDVRLSRGWYGLLSLERSDGDVEDNARVHTSVVWRF